MPPEYPTSNEEIRDTVEWRLLYWLRENSRRFISSREENVHDGPRNGKLKKLHNAIQFLNIQIRLTFTILNLDLILYLEEEDSDDASQTSSESEDDWGFSQSDDDSAPRSLFSSSQSRLSFRHRQQSSRRTDFPSSDEAMSHLKTLCSLLEARVNHEVAPAITKDSSQSEKYPRLSRLKEYLSQLSTRPLTVEFIPCYGLVSKQFLFNIAEDSTIARSFVAFTNPESEHPKQDTRKQMLKSAKDLADCFSKFNKLVSKLEFSATSLSKLVGPPNDESVMVPFLPMTAQLHRFRRQLGVAYQTILSHVRCCSTTEPQNHEILLQLPSKEHIAVVDQGNVEENQSVQIFFNLCSEKTDKWQLGKMSFLPPKDNVPRINLCDALQNSHDCDTDLEFGVTEDWRTYCLEEVPIQVPIRQPGPRTYTTSFSDNKDSLRDMIIHEFFAKEPTLNMLLYTDERGTVLGRDQRKTLAVKLVLGLMVSMDSDFQAWNPKSIYFLDSMDNEHRPFVSVPGVLNSEARRERLSLHRLPAADSINSTEEKIKPIPQFTLMAETLLQILLSQNPPSQRSNQLRTWKSRWQNLRRAVNMYVKEVCSKKEVNRQKLSFLHAIQGCLDFPIVYRNRIAEATSKRKVDVAWEVIFDTILSNIDEKMFQDRPKKDYATKVPFSSMSDDAFSASLVMSSQTHANANRGEDMVEHADQNVNIATEQLFRSNEFLFDSKEAPASATAPEFWTHFEKFHKSYLRFVSDRNTVDGKEYPRRIRVAILDTGVDFNHQAIRNAMDNGRLNKDWCYSWVGENSDVRDDDDELHGTHCVDLLHRSAPEADIYVAKVFKQNSVRSYEAENIARAIEHAANKWDVDIISMSFGLREPSALDDEVVDKDKETAALNEYRKMRDGIEDAILEASHKPRIIFAAASNDGMNRPPAFPADYPRVFAVHASHGNGEDGGINPAANGNFQIMTLGMGIALSKRVWRSKGNRKFPIYKPVHKSGTSFATPITAGIAATVLDVTSRVEEIDKRVSDKLRRPEAFEKVLRLMAQKKGKAGLHYMAPWLHWETGWQSNESKVRSSWYKINELF